MHILQPKHIKLKPDEIKKVLDKYNVTLSQLPKIRINDPGVPENSQVGDVLKIERRDGEKIKLYFRVVVV